VAQFTAHGLEEETADVTLECPRCLRTRVWDRASQPEGPGYCTCGAWAFWRVYKPRPPGSV